MSLQESPAALQRELDTLQRELRALMEQWADTDCFAAQQLGRLECRRQLLLARIKMRQRALASYPQPVENPVDDGLAQAV